MIDRGFCDAIGLAAPDDPTPLVSNDCVFVSLGVFNLLWAGKKEKLLKVQGCIFGFSAFLFFSTITVTLFTAVSSSFFFGLLLSSLSIFGLQHRANQPRELHAVHDSGCWGVIYNIFAALRSFDSVMSMLYLLMVIYVCFPGASLTRCHPLRAVGRRRYSASTWQRDTVKPSSVSTALMTFSSPDPKVNTHNHPALHPSLTSLTLLSYRYSSHVSLLRHWQFITL